MRKLNSELELLETALGWSKAGYAVALGTVIRTSGSAPRQCGSHLVVREDGAFAGSVSAGCIEAKVIETALAVMKSQRPRRLAFDSTAEGVFEAGLLCGGNIEVFVESLSRPENLRQLLAGARSGHVVARAVNLETGEERLIAPGSDTTSLGLAIRQLHPGQQGTVAAFEGHDWFVAVYEQPWELVIAGAVHVAQALCTIAAAAGFAVRVIDPRSAYLNEDRFPEAQREVAWPDLALAQEPLTASSALVALAHDPKIDDPALIHALRSDWGYVGALGSVRTHARRKQRLAAQGLPQELIDRIHAPVGIAIGARSPMEIAIAVVAEIIATRQKAWRSAGS